MIHNVTLRNVPLIDETRLAQRQIALKFRSVDVGGGEENLIVPGKE